MLDGQYQLRVTPAGHVLGLDMAGLLALAEARALDLSLTAELLPAAERGLLEAMEDGD